MEFSFVSVFSLSLFLSFSFFMPSHLVFYFFIFFKIPYEIANTCLATIYNSIGLTLLDLSLCRFNNNNNKNTLRDLCVYVFFSLFLFACLLCYFVGVSFNSKRYFNILLSSERMCELFLSFVCLFVLSFIRLPLLRLPFVRSLVRSTLYNPLHCMLRSLINVHTHIHTFKMCRRITYNNSRKQQ